MGKWKWFWIILILIVIAVIIYLLFGTETGSSIIKGTGKIPSPPALPD